MAEHVVEYARFVEVQQRRARVAGQLQPPPTETARPSIAENPPIEGESRRRFSSTPNRAARDTQDC